MVKLLKSREFWIVLGLTLIGVGLRLWRLGEPTEIVFDETYYAKWANDYLLGNSFFDVHPPLGKLLIALGIKLFGNDAFGWRIMPALFGMAVVPLTFFVAKRLFATNGGQKTENREQTKVAILATLFVLLDGLLLVQSRTALLDSFQITFVLATVAGFLAFRDAQTRRSATIWLLVTGVFLGLSLATKWTTLAILGLVVLYLVVWRRTLPRVGVLIYAFSFVIIPLLIYIGSFVFNERTLGFVPYLIDWHQQTWNFHRDLTATHPYASRWWSWLYLGRPVWYFYKESEGIVRGIIALGNPILWWSAIPALMAAIWTTRRDLAHGLAFPALAVLAFYLPWTIIGRTQFQYYLAPAVPFLMIVLAQWLAGQARALRWTISALAAAAFVFWYPLLIGTPVSSAFYRAHLWFRSWI